MKRWWWLLACVVCAVAQAGDYPAPIQALIREGIAIKGAMQAPQGYKGYVGEYNGDPIPIYLLPDGQHVIVGTLYDAQGKDLTDAAFKAATHPAMDPALWGRLGRSTWIAEGAVKPQRIVYIFTDTDCPYCHRLWLELQPYMRRNKVQVRNIIVAVIAPESLGRGAAVLSAANPAATWRRHELAFGHSPLKPLTSIPTALRAKINANTALIKSIDSFGTPAIVYRDDNEKIRMILGVPDADKLRTIFGG